MRKLFHFLALLLPLSGVFAQTPGTLDLSFNGTGFAFTQFPNGGVNQGFAMLMMHGDRSVVVGRANDTISSPTVHFAMLRYKKNGTIDSTFGTNGFVKTEIGSTSSAYAAAQQSDGKIIIAGETNNAAMAVARYDSSGVLDPSFGNAGVAVIAVGTTHDVAYSVCVLPDGRIMLSGYTDDGSRYMLALVRLHTNGLVDSTFGTNGTVTMAVDPTGYSEGFAVAAQPDGKIVVAGQIHSIGQGYVARFHPDGAIDSTFGTDGIAKTAESGAEDSYVTMLLLDNGNILCGGSYMGSLQMSPDFGIIMYDSTGIPDPNFGVNGRAVTDIGPGHGDISGMAIQQNGQIVVGGTSGGAGTNDFSLARFNTDGTIDNAFGTNGQTLTGSLGEMQFANALALQYDGKIVASGRVSNFYPVSNSGFGIARYYGTPTTWGLTEQNNGSGNKIYPVPASETINVYTPSGSTEVQILDIRGAAIGGGVIIERSGSISLGGMAPGIYIMRITDRNSAKVEYLKFIRN